MANKSTLSQYTASSNITSNRITGLLDIDRVKANPLYRCTISGGRYASGNGKSAIASISGIYNSDAPFSISVGSEYADTFEMPEVIEKLNSALGWAANMSGKTQFILKSVRMTEQRWNGSTNPEFSVKIDIPIVRKKDAPWDVIKYVLQTTSGTMNDYNGAGQVQRAESAWQIFAPNGYKVNYRKRTGGPNSDSPEGTYTISLGSGSRCWFRMTNAIITNVDCSIGNKKYYDGNPTFVSVSIRFKFWRLALLEDMLNWFPLSSSAHKIF